ncbi:MAG: iron-sulfur cluster assembly protein [Anaerolineales bacterium]|jgi:metal-sulfur cluster biosynthetic enzyme
MSDTIQNKPVWDIESTNPEIVKPLIAELNKVMDPEIGLNVLELGLVRNVAVIKGEAKLMMIMTTPFCPYGPALLETTRQQAEIGLKLPTSITLSYEPWDPSMMDENARMEWGFF